MLEINGKAAKDVRACRKLLKQKDETVQLKLKDKKGEVKNVKVLRGVNKFLDAEAVRVIKAMPNWKPGLQRGKPVNVLYMIPINFELH